jgi:hypothetical protein
MRVAAVRSEKPVAQVREFGSPEERKRPSLEAATKKRPLKPEKTLFNTIFLTDICQYCNIYIFKLVNKL